MTLIDQMRQAIFQELNEDCLSYLLKRETVVTLDKIVKHVKKIHIRTGLLVNGYNNRHTSE